MYLVKICTAFIFSNQNFPKIFDCKSLYVPKKLPESANISYQYLLYRITKNFPKNFASVFFDISATFSSNRCKFFIQILQNFLQSYPTFTIKYHQTLPEIFVGILHMFFWSLITILPKLNKFFSQNFHCKTIPKLIYFVIIPRKFSGILRKC